MAAGGHRADKCRVRSRQFDHARLVAKNAAAADWAAWIDRYHRDPQAVANQQHAEGFQKGTLSGSRRAGDAEAQGVAGEGHNRIQQLGAQRLVAGMLTLHQRHGLGERGPLAQT